MSEPLVEKMDKDQYLDILRNKWRFLNKELQENTEELDTVKKCLTKQSEYVSGELFLPIKIIWDNKEYIFLQVDVNKFSSKEEKKEFLEEVNTLREIDFKVKKQTLLKLEDFLQGYTPTSKKKIPLIQVFVL